MEPTPLYIRVDQYRELVSAIGKLDAKLQSVETSIHKILDLKREEDDELRVWTETLSDIKERALRITEVTRR